MLPAGGFHLIAWTDIDSFRITLDNLTEIYSKALPSPTCVLPSPYPSCQNEWDAWVPEVAIPSPPLPTQ